ncbi:MAG: DNA polymerase III subunit delta, partial [Myxococcales bacterium]|nr:DNA polymerase III subunit delta [Myxococcales bacterium]
MKRGSSGVDPRALIQEISRKLAPVYLLYGDEPAAISQVVTAVREAVIPPSDATAVSMAAFNHERFEGSEVTAVKRVLEACAQVPMLSKFRLVEVANPDAIGEAPDAAPGATAVDALCAYLESPSPSTILVLHGSGLDGRGKLVAAARKHGWAHRFAALERDQDAVAYVMAEARRRGRQLDEDAARRIVEAVGTGQSQVLEALDRVSLHAGDGTRLTRADVDAVVARTRDADVFAFTDAVGAGEYTKALSMLATMFSAGERDTSTTMWLFALLIRQFRLLFVARFAPPGQVASLAGIPPFVADKLVRQASQYTPERLRAAYAGLVRLDRDLKGGSWVAYASPYMALQRWILDTCQALPGVAPR